VKLGLVAAGGPFPAKVAEAALAAGHQVFVICLRDFCDDPALRQYPHLEERIGAGGAIVQRLKVEGVTHLALCGRARRPSLTSLWPDAWMARTVARMGKALFGGDDAVLRAGIAILVEEGFEIIAPQSLLGASSATAGLLAGPAPDELAREDIRRGIAVLRAMAEADVGQAVVVQQGLILGVEAIEGTDALLARAGELRREGPGGILVKLAKTGQEMRVDAPVVGPVTVQMAEAAGLRGIAIEAESTILAERAAMLKAAEAVGIFVLAIQPEEFLRNNGEK